MEFSIDFTQDLNLQSLHHRKIIMVHANKTFNWSEWTKFFCAAATRFLCKNLQMRGPVLHWIFRIITRLLLNTCFWLVICCQIFLIISANSRKDSHTMACEFTYRPHKTTNHRLQLKSFCVHSIRRWIWHFRSLSV